MIHKAKNLSPDQRILVESLLGRRVLDNEAISVRAFEPPVISDQRRQQITEDLKRYFAEVDAHRKLVSPAEADDIFDEAMRSTRPSYRPHRQ